MKPKRIQLARRSGWRMPANTVKVDRATPWGNPFVVGVHGTQARCVELLELLCGNMLCLTTDNLPEQRRFLDHTKEHITDLRGKNLACWCKPGTPCHADVLLKIANK